MKTLKSRFTSLWLCLACQHRISRCLMKYNRSVISSLWLALPAVGAKSPLGTVLIINLLGKGLTPRACMGDGGSIWWAPGVTYWWPLIMRLRKPNYRKLSKNSFFTHGDVISGHRSTLSVRSNNVYAPSCHTLFPCSLLFWNGKKWNNKH